MNTKFLENFYKNWIAKVVCLLLAVFIYVVYQTSMLFEKEVVVPVNIIQNGNMTLASSVTPVNSVRVTLRGKQEQLLEITENDVEAYIDINSQNSAGTYDFPVFVRPSNRLMLVDPLEIKLSKEKLNLQIENKIFRYIPVSATLSGSPARGYQVDEVFVQPSTVKVTGPYSVVTGIQFIQTEKVDIEGITRESVINTSIVNTNSLITVESFPSYEVRVKTTASPLTKEFSSVPIEYINLDGAFEITSSAQTTDITIKGGMLLVESSDSSLIKAQADCSAVKDEGVFDVPVSAEAGEGLEIDNISKPRIQITVARKKVYEATDEEGEDSQAQGEENL